MNESPYVKYDDDEVVSIADEHVPKLRNMLIHLGHDPGEAENILNDAVVDWIKLWQREPKREPQALLYKLVKHRSVDEYRRRDRRPVPLADDSLLAVAADELRSSISGMITPLDVRRALHQLPERQRQVVVLRKAFNFEIVEVAALLACKPDDVKNLQRAALETLRKSPLLAGYAVRIPPEVHP